MKKLLSSLLVFTLLIFAGCSGGGGGGTNVAGNVYYTHRQLAHEFVRRLELDLGYDLNLVKVNTLQYDYIVVYDYDTKSYDALWIGAYQIGRGFAALYAHLRQQILLPSQT